ncbi:hypothetical protein [Chryseobacterium sp. StRB126]|uniref:hypothetical protein n=1 Tax=Chryseobacterium sp. StRB126 TaxID=878220 RepID=UPI0005EE9EBC|nr:hypothetical protein [Chryseobacterium sp. StRB126]
MEKISREQRGFIRQLHYRNEEFFDKGLIEYGEYIENNFLLLRQVRYSNLNYEQKLILAESISINLNLDKFRLGIKIAQLGFN